MKKATFKVVYNRLNKLNTDGTGLIQIECYLNRKRKYLSTGIKIKPIYWNSKKNTIKSNHPNYIELNRMLDIQLRNIEDFEFKQIEKNGVFFLDDLGSINNNHLLDNKSFLEFCWDSLASNTSVSKGTINHHKVMLKKLQEYQKNIRFSDLKFIFIKGFDDFLRKKGLHTNTIANHHKDLKVFINLAIKQGMFNSDDYPYKSFKVKKVPTNRTFLTNLEIDKINNIVFTEETKSIEFVRDMFIFSCYTGLRFSDVQDLKNKHITKDDEGYYLKIKMNKTQDYIKLPISLLFKGKAMSIVEKYKDGFSEKFLFPRISNQKANMKLKVVALVGGINKNLTFHISRHTFGTNLASATSDQFLIKELMGHSDIKTSMIYIHTSQEHIKNKLKSANWE